MTPKPLSAPPPNLALLSISEEPLPSWRSGHRNWRAPIRKMARKRAQQRWSALLTRIHHQMRSLDDWLWRDFVAHANKYYKPAFVSVFDSLLLSCVGPVGGGPCGFIVDLTSHDAFHTLGMLHLDHEQDLVITCDLWKRALPHDPIAWDEGVDHSLLCHLLFGVAPHPMHGKEMLRFRCGPRAFCCHKINMPHYEVLRDVAA